MCSKSTARRCARCDCVSVKQLVTAFHRILLQAIDYETLHANAKYVLLYMADSPKSSEYFEGICSSKSIEKTRYAEESSAHLVALTIESIGN